jgi:hypothetical protein
MPSVAEQVARRPLWAQIALSAAFTATLVAFGAASAFLGHELATDTTGAWVFVVLAYLLAVPFLVYYAYPPLRRRWYHYAAYEACVVGAFTLAIPLVYLPWLIVTRREWRRG